MYLLPNSDWLIGLSACVVIGQCNYFGFGFTTLKGKPLYRVRHDLSWFDSDTIFQSFILLPVQVNENTTAL